MKNLLNKAHDLTRRDFAANMAKSLLALNIVPMTSQAAIMKTLPGGGKAKSVIFIRVTGGLSHVDSFDIKEKNKDAMKASSPIKTNADGIRVGKYFSKLA